MRFRTEIEISKSNLQISHSDKLVLLGSCFTDEIGSRLEADGFNALHNPFGPLYNPLSLAKCIKRAVTRQHYTAEELYDGPRGFHCLDYASRYSGSDAESVLQLVNGTLDILSDAIGGASTVILTLGSAWIFSHNSSGQAIGNCHKFVPACFNRRLLSVEECVTALDDILTLLQKIGVKGVILTISPIRHLADGLNGNTISKSTLHLAAMQLGKKYDNFVHYFPSYEIMIDDLRDYRFYASDMKHPSQVAIDYIYENFGIAYFSSHTLAQAAEAHKSFLAEQHRQIL